MSRLHTPRSGGRPPPRAITRPRLNSQCSPVLLLIIISLDSTGGPGGDTYSPQHLGQSGGQTGTGPVGVDIPTDRYPTSGQYGGQERVTTSQTAGYADPTRDIAGGGGRRSEDDDDEYGAAVGPGGGPKGKPSMTSKVKGATEKMTSKIMGDPGKQARGREREEGTI